MQKKECTCAHRDALPPLDPDGHSPARTLSNPASAKRAMARTGKHLKVKETVTALFMQPELGFLVLPHRGPLPQQQPICRSSVAWPWPCMLLQRVPAEVSSKGNTCLAKRLRGHSAHPVPGKPPISVLLQFFVAGRVAL